MRYFGKFTLPLLCLFLILGFPPRLRAQTPTATPHGVLVTYNASTSVVQGYYIFRCPGTCTSGSTGWITVNAALNAGLSFLDLSTGTGAPLNGSTYSYAALAVDANGNQSGLSNVSTLTIPGSWPTNPAPPSGCNTKVQ